MATQLPTPTPSDAASNPLARLRSAMQGNPTEMKWLAGAITLFVLIWFLPVGTARFDGAVLEGLALLNWYAQEHVLLCLVPAFFIAGAIAVFLSKDAVMKYLGPTANQVADYGVA